MNVLYKKKLIIHQKQAENNAKNSQAGVNGYRVFEKEILISFICKCFYSFLSYLYVLFNKDVRWDLKDHKELKEGGVKFECVQSSNPAVIGSSSYYQ